MGRVRKDGTSFPLGLGSRGQRRQARQPQAIHIACVRDISERKSYTEALQHQVLHDDLRSCRTAACSAIASSRESGDPSAHGEPLALLLLDLDGFKQVNDRLGHQIGDELLGLVAERLVGCLRDGDTVARLGGDEFGILPHGRTDVAGAAGIAWKIEQALAEDFVIAGQSVGARSSIGIVLVPEHGDNIDDLLRRADLAMYGAKRSGSGYAMFAAEQEQAPARRLALLSDLQDVHRARRAAAQLPAQGRPRDAGDDRGRGPDSLEAPLGTARTCRPSSCRRSRTTS